MVTKRKKKRPAKVKKKRLGLQVIPFGPPGIGKTSLMAQMPSPYFICDPNERGIERLVEFNNVEIPQGIKHDCFESITEINERLEDFIQDSEGFESIILESMTGLELIGKLECVDTDYGGDSSEFLSYGKGYDMLNSKYMTPLRRNLGILAGKGIHTMVTGHSKAKTMVNVLGADYSAITVDVTPKIWSSWHTWAGGLWFLNKELTVVKDDPNNKRKAAKVKDAERVLFTDSTEYAFEAKDQYGLPDQLEMNGTPAENWKLISDEIGL